MQVNRSLLLLEMPVLKPIGNQRLGKSGNRPHLLPVNHMRHSIDQLFALFVQPPVVLPEARNSVTSPTLKFGSGVPLGVGVGEGLGGGEGEAVGGLSYRDVNV